MLFGIFSKITRRKILDEKITNSEPGVYLYIVFPIAVAFLITFIVARVISHVSPNFFIHIVPNLHIHHYSYGIFVLTISGYLALASDKARDKYLISLMHGVGLGLAFDEFGLWLKMSDDDPTRWSYDGVLILTALFFLLLSAETGMKMWRRHFGLKKPWTEPRIEPVLEPEKPAFEPPSGA
ncbi:hypothetical protein KW791_00800 [Candidatus Parcubacteria bacterium]|nr:hypothetical protein [Candidatus Parcubacteria bacterium]